MTNPVFEIESVPVNQAFEISNAEGASSIDSNVFNNVGASKLAVNSVMLDKADTLLGVENNDIPLPQEDKLSADMPTDKTLQDRIKAEIDTNKKLLEKKETLANVLSAAFMSMVKSKPKAANTNLGMLLRNNQTAIMRANIINRAVVRHQKTNEHLNSVLEKHGVEKTPEAIEKAVKENPQVKEAFKMSEAARAHLMNQISDPDAQRAIKTAKEGGMIGAQSEIHLDNALKRAANELDKDSVNKASMEKLSEKLSEMMDSLADFMDSILNRFSSAATPS